MKIEGSSLFGTKWVDVFYLFQYKLSARSYIQSRFIACLIISMHFITFLMDLMMDPPEEAQKWLRKTYFYEGISSFLSLYQRLSTRKTDDPLQPRVLWVAPCILTLMAVFLIVQFVLLRVTSIEKTLSKNRRRVWLHALHYSNYVYICFYWIGNQTLIFNVNNLLIMSVFSDGNANVKILMSVLYGLTLLACASFAQLSYILSSDHIPSEKNCLAYVHYWSPLIFNMLTTGAHLIKELIKQFEVDLLHMFYSFVFYNILLVLLERYHQFFNPFMSNLTKFWIALIFSVNLAFFFSHIKVFIFTESDWYSYQDPLLITLFSLPFYFYAKQRSADGFNFKMSKIFRFEKLSSSEFILYLNNCLKTVENLEGLEESLFWVSVYQYHKSTCEDYKNQNQDLHSQVTGSVISPQNPKTILFGPQTPANHVGNIGRKKRGCFCLEENDVSNMKKKGLRLTNRLSPENFRLLRLLRVYFESVLSSRGKKKQMNSLGYLYICYSSFLYVYFSNATIAFLFLNIANRYLKKVSFKEQIMMKNLMQLINKNQVKILTDEQQGVANNLEACIKAETNFHSKFIPEFLRILHTNIDFWDFITKNTGNNFSNKSIVRPPLIESFMKLLDKHHKQADDMKDCFTNLMEISPRYSVTLKAYSLFKLFVMNDELDAIKLNKSVLKIINDQSKLDFRNSSHKIDGFFSERASIIRVSGLKETFGNIVWVSSRSPKFFGMISKNFMQTQNFTSFLPNSIKSYHGKFVSNYYSGALSTNGILFHMRKGFVVTVHNELVPTLLYVKPFLQISGTIQFSAFFRPYPQPPDEQIYYITTSMTGIIDGFSKNLMDLLQIDPKIANFTSLEIEDIIRKVRPFYVKLLNKFDTANKPKKKTKGNSQVFTKGKKRHPKSCWDKEYKQVDFIITEETWKKIFEAPKMQVPFFQNDEDSFGSHARLALELKDASSFNNMEAHQNGSKRFIREETVQPLLSSLVTGQFNSLGFEEFQNKFGIGSRENLEKPRKHFRLKCDVRPKKFATSNESFYTVVLEIRNINFLDHEEEDALENDEGEERQMGGVGFNWVLGESSKKRVPTLKGTVNQRLKKEKNPKIRRTLLTIEIKKSVKNFKKEINDLLSGAKKGKGLNNTTWKFFVIVFTLLMVVCSGVFAYLSYVVTEVKINDYEMAMINLKFPFLYLQQFIEAFIPFLQLNFFYSGSLNLDFFESSSVYTVDFFVDYIDQVNDQLFRGYHENQIGLKEKEDSIEACYEQIGLSYDLVYSIKTILATSSVDLASIEMQMLENKVANFMESLDEYNVEISFIEAFKTKMDHGIFLIRFVFGFSIFLIAVFSVISIAIMVFLETRVNNLIYLFLSIPHEKAKKYMSLRYSLKNRITSVLEDFDPEKFDKMFEKIEFTTYCIDSRKPIKATSVFKPKKLMEILESHKKTEFFKPRSIFENLMKKQAPSDQVSPLRRMKNKAISLKESSKIRFIFNLLSYLIRMLGITYLGFLCIGYFIIVERYESNIRDTVLLNIDEFEATFEDFVSPYASMDTTLSSILSLLCTFYRENYSISHVYCTELETNQLVFPINTPFQSSQFIESVIQYLADDQNRESLLESEFCTVFTETYFFSNEKGKELQGICKSLLSRFSTESDGYLVMYQNLAKDFENNLVGTLTDTMCFSTENGNADSSLSFFVSFENYPSSEEASPFVRASFTEALENYIFVLGVSNFAMFDYLFLGEWERVFRNMEKGNQIKTGYCCCFFLEVFIICVVLLWSTLNTLFRMKSYKSMLRLFPDTLIRKNKEILLYLGGKMMLKSLSE